ncbi:ABC transporter substrate-binding protein [Brucella pseudogrignonensis]|uniref:ABC transporter substrate-binding protein n=1 Tax=Brucella pseudogrignonensis TaxID=419475 RepID=UPI001E31165F|nr:ABC transporter substrate-binding protein [Brucella pseudogrignonensis]MCD4511797.1 ABC transporter substrate-binding protein [Brucella pseudogrignonensis]
MQHFYNVKLLTRRSLLGGFATLAAGVRARAAWADVPSAIAATDWAAAETLLALGIVPLAIPDTAVYRQWMGTTPLPASVYDLGSRTEPNFEMLAALRPDCILISNWQANLAAKLGLIAPVHKVTIIDPPQSPLANARRALLEIGSLVSKEQAARQWLAEFDTVQRAAFTSLRDCANRDVIVGVLHENGRQIYAYGSGSWVHEVILLLGLNNALRAPTSRFGNALIDIAQLAEIPKAQLLYLDQGSRTRQAEIALAQSTVWNRIPMVQAQHVHRIPVFYPLGGLPSVRRFADILVSVIAQPGNRP